VLTIAIAVLLVAALCVPILSHWRSAARPWLVSAIVAGGAGLTLFVLRDAPPAAPLADRIAALAEVPPEQMTLDEAGVVIAERVRVSPDDATAWSFLAQIRRDQGRASEALEARRQAWRLDPTPARQFEFAEALIEADAGMISKEVAALYETLTLDPQTPETLRQASRFVLGEKAWQDQETDRALEYWRVALAAIPSDTAFFGELAFRGFDLVGTPSAGPIDAPMLEAGVAAGLNPADMVARLKARLDEKPDDPQLWLQAIRAEWRLGNIEEARMLTIRARDHIDTAPYTYFLETASAILHPRDSGQGEDP
jgi:cytochrome c-type biogenesis protein CcmH/NrfG